MVSLDGNTDDRAGLVCTSVSAMWASSLSRLDFSTGEYTKSLVVATEVSLEYPGELPGDWSVISAEFDMFLSFTSE